MERLFDDIISDLGQKTKIVLDFIINRTAFDINCKNNAPEKNPGNENLDCFKIRFYAPVLRVSQNKRLLLKKVDRRRIENKVMQHLIRKFS